MHDLAQARCDNIPCSVLHLLGRCENGVDWAEGTTCLISQSNRSDYGGADTKLAVRANVRNSGRLPIGSFPSPLTVNLSVRSRPSAAGPAMRFLS